MFVTFFQRLRLKLEKTCIAVLMKRDTSCSFARNLPAKESPWSSSPSPWATGPSGWSTSTPWEAPTRLDAVVSWLAGNLDIINTFYVVPVTYHINSWSPFCSFLAYHACLELKTVPGSCPLLICYNLWLPGSYQSSSHQLLPTFIRGVVWYGRVNTIHKVSKAVSIRGVAIKITRLHKFKLGVVI